MVQRDPTSRNIESGKDGFYQQECRTQQAGIMLEGMQNIAERLILAGMQNILRREPTSKNVEHSREGSYYQECRTYQGGIILAGIQNMVGKDPNSINAQFFILFIKVLRTKFQSLNSEYLLGTIVIQFSDPLKKHLKITYYFFNNKYLLPNI